MAISQLERFKSTVAHKKHPGFLFYAEFAPDLEKRVRQEFGLDEEVNLRDYFGMFNHQVVVPRRPENYAQPDFKKYYQDLEVPTKVTINELGVLCIPGSEYHFVRFISPLRNAQRLEDLESFVYPNIEGYTEKYMADEVKAAHALGKAVSGWVGHMYESAWQIRGYEEFLMDMLDRPEWCEYIH